MSLVQPPELPTSASLSSTATRSRLRVLLAAAGRRHRTATGATMATIRRLVCVLLGHDRHDVTIILDVSKRTITCRRCAPPADCRPGRLSG
jgi:hypothetical protein